MTQEKENLTKQSTRILSIDVFKGITVLVMVFLNSIHPYDNVPAWSKHAGEYGLTYVDLIATFFVFMYALNMNISYSRRVEKVGKKRAVLRYIRRSLILIGIGLVVTIGAGSEGIFLRWGTLQVLGFSGLMLLPLLALKPYVKLIFAIIFLILHQIILSTPLRVIIYDSVEGGIFGIFSWGSMMFLVSFLAESLTKGREYIKRYFLFGGLICLLLGIGSAFLWQISRPYVSLPYILISVGVASLIYLLIYYIYEEWGKNYNFVKNEKIFSAVGKNAFIFFLVHMMIAFTIYSIFPFDATLIILVPLAIVHTAFIWLLAYYMNKVEMFIVI